MLLTMRKLHSWEQVGKIATNRATEHNKKDNEVHNETCCAPDIEDRMEIPRGDVHWRSALQPEIRRPIVLEIPTTAIKNEASEEDNPLLSPIADNLQKIPNNEDKFSPFSNIPNVRRKY